MTPGPAWDDPSRFGAGGLAARRALERALKPLRVRYDARLDALDDAVAAQRAELVGLAAASGALEARLRTVTRDTRDARGEARATGLVLDAMLERTLPEETRTRSSHGDGSRVICSLATGRPYRQLLARSGISFERYAERWGWDLVLSTEGSLAAGRPPSWAKVPLLLELLEQHEWVLWIDADVVIVDVEADILAETRAGYDQFLVEHPWLGQHTANVGVWLLRGGAWSAAYLREVWAQEHRIDHPFWENQAALDLLGYAEDPSRLVEPTAWGARTRFIDRRFNSIELDPAPRPAFVHRGFYDTATRSRQVTADLACVLGGADPMTAGRRDPARVISDVADVRRRDELPLLLNALGLVEGAMELGTYRGQFSEHLLTHWRGDRLFSIDPWRAFADGDYVDRLNVEQEAQDANHHEVVGRLERFGERSIVWRATGEEAAPSFPPRCLDFVYLDAQHDEASVRADLATWWPKLRPGAILAGHDYFDDREHANGEYGVKSAVDAFCAEHGLELHVTTGDGDWPSWLLRVPS